MAGRAFKNAAYTHLAGVGKALSNPVRLELLELLVQAPHTVESLASAVDQSIANTSNHLQVLRRSHLVERESRGVYGVYRIVGPEVATLATALHSVAAAHAAGLRELTREVFAADADPVGVAELVQRIQRGEAMLIDVRPSDEFDAGHLPGATSIPIDQLESRLDTLPEDREIVAYCRGPFCTFSIEAVERLRARGLQARRTTATVADAAQLEAAWAR